MTRKILRLQEVADRTQLPLATLRYYRHKGLGPKTWTLGRRVVAFEDDVEAWIAEQAQAARGGAA